MSAGKHQTTGHAHQVVCDLLGNLRHMSDPRPGHTPDAKAMQDTGLPELLGQDHALGDTGSLGTGPTTPFRTPAGGELVDWHKEFTTSINKVRSVVERAIAHVTT